jgi:hypothetical protein
LEYFPRTSFDCGLQILAPYQDLGRPTIRRRGEKVGSTLDFTLHHKETGKTYVAELKCEIEYQNYKYLLLTDANQLDHHRKGAFRALLDAAIKSSQQQVFVSRKEIAIDGAILIWGAATPEGRQSVLDAKGFFEVLTMAHIIRDLIAWNHEAYKTLIEERKSWANELFQGLARAEPGVSAALSPPSLRHDSRQD